MAAGLNLVLQALWQGRVKHHSSWHPRWVGCLSAGTSVPQPATMTGLCAEGHLPCSHCMLPQAKIIVTRYLPSKITLAIPLQVPEVGCPWKRWEGIGGLASVFDALCRGQAVRWEWRSGPQHCGQDGRPPGWPRPPQLPAPTQPDKSQL